MRINLREENRNEEKTVTHAKFNTLFEFRDTQVLVQWQWDVNSAIMQCKLGVTALPFEESHYLVQIELFTLKLNQF